MAFNYANAALTANRLITNFGQDVTLRQQAQSGTEWNPTLTNTDTTVKVVDLKQVKRNADGTLQEKATRTLYMSVEAGAVPAQNDKVQIDGEWHTILEVRPLNPAGTAVMYECDIED